MIRILSYENVHQTITMPQVIKATKATFAQLSTGQADVALWMAL